MKEKFKKSLHIYDLSHDVAAAVVSRTDNFRILELTPAELIFLQILECNSSLYSKVNFSWEDNLKSIPGS